MNNARMQTDDDDDDHHHHHQYIDAKQILTTTRTDELISLPTFEEFQYSSHSHDSLIQFDHHMDTATSSIDDLTRTNQLLSSDFRSKDSALDLSDENINRSHLVNYINQKEQIVPLTTFQDKIIDSKRCIDDETMICIHDESYLTEDEKSVQRTVSSSSSEQLIPKEKQTGMYYKAFGSAAAIHLAEQYRCEWLQEVPIPLIDEKSPNTDDSHLRIVHQSQTIGDNEDEFYFSPQTLYTSSSCPDLYGKPTDCSAAYQQSYSLTTLDAYKHLNITHETLEQIWLSLLDVAFSDRDDYELGEYKLRHIIGLSNSYSTMSQSIIEKSRSHNDIFSIAEKSNQKSITKSKSKSFDITSLIKQSSSLTNSANIGLLQGADISEPFADRFISASMQSDLESIQSLEHEHIRHEISPSPPPPILKEPLNFVFNFAQQIDNDDYDLESAFETENRSLITQMTFDPNDIPPVLPMEDTYLELSKFRPHSLSTIPSSRASQYASSIDSDDIFEREHNLHKQNIEENNQYHMSDDDHGLIGSEFSSPRSRPLSSIHSRSASPEQNQQSKSVNISDSDGNMWEQSTNEPKSSEDLFVEENSQYSAFDLMSTIPFESFNSKQTDIMEQIEPVLLLQDDPDLSSFIQQIDQSAIHPSIGQESHLRLDANDLVDRLIQLNPSNKSSIHQYEHRNNFHIIDELEQHSKLNVDHLTSIVTDIHQINDMQTSDDKLSLQQSFEMENKQPLSTVKPANNPLVHSKHQRIDKVTDLEIMKQGKGFKIGYIDRQGTDQRVILTKRIEAGPDVMERDPHIRVPFKGRRLLNQIFTSVLFTNGFNALQEDKKFQRSDEGVEVPIIGTNPKHFDESDMISIDIDGPSTMLNSICESIVITQGSVYSQNASKSQPDIPTNSPISNKHEEHLEISHLLKKEKVEIIDSWHDHTIINGTGTPWRSSFKPTKKHISPVNTTQTQQSPTDDIDHSRHDSYKLNKITHEIALSPVSSLSEKQYQTTGTSPIKICQTVDRSCQYSPPVQYDQGLQCYFKTITSYTQVSPSEIPGFHKTQDGIQTNQTLTSHPVTLERSADSGILVDHNHLIKTIPSSELNSKHSSSDSEDTSEVTTRPLIRQTSPTDDELYEEETIEHDSNPNATTSEIEQEISQLCRERAHILDLLSLNWSRSNIWVELTEAKLNYIIGETDALLRALSFDSNAVDNETVKIKMQQYEEDMAELTRQHLAVYRERLEASKKELDIKIDELELKKSSIENSTPSCVSTSEQTPRSTNSKRTKSFLSTSVENLTTRSNQENIASHPHLLDVSFLTTTPSNTTGLPCRLPDQPPKPSETVRTIHRPTPRYPTPNNHKYDYSTKTNNGNLSHMEGLSKSQQAILDETDKLVKDSQQLHTESASQFERARESLLSSETPIRLARANMAASRLQSYSGMKTYLPNDVTLAELFKYEQSLAKETANNSRHMYTSPKTTTHS